MRVNEKMKKALSALLCVSMLVQNAPVVAFAAQEDCTHHTKHTAECGYVEAVAGVPCAHVHDENCGYVEAVAEVLCACEATDENGAIVHTEGCGYVAPVTGAECTHVHDDACGYVAAVEGHECHYECAECAIAPANEEPGDETPVCSCTVKCGETADTNCAVCSAAGADPSAVCNGAEEPPVVATNNIDAAEMTPEDLKAAVDAALAAGYTAITVNLAEDADATMFSAIAAALAADDIADGSINLTISGAKTVPEYGFFDDGDYSDNDDKNIAGDKLKSLTLTDVETIGEYAFSACTYLESVNLPQVVTIGECAFNEWEKGTKLTSLNLPNATTIGDWAFAYSSLLTSINLPKVTSIGALAFGYCDLRTLNLPEVTTIDGEAFLNNDNLVSCSAPKATTIDYYPWGKCSRMETLELTAAGGFTLGNNLFAYTSTEQIDLVLNKDKESQVTQNADGTVTWKPTNSDGGKLEYTFKSITFVYSIEVSAIENGTVTADKSTATEGETVTLTVTAAEGYILDTLTVMNGGTPVEVTGNSFTMPAGDVTVSATFKACDHSGGAHTSATDLGDGKHSFTCSVCDTSVTEPHSIGTDGKCACGLTFWTVEGNTLTIDGTLGGKTMATDDDVNALLEAIKGYVDRGITTLIVTGSNPALYNFYDVDTPAVSAAIFLLTESDEGRSYYGTIDLILPNVTEIVQDEFAEAYALNSITLPKVTKLGERAFSVAEYLQTITFGSVLTEVDESTGPVFLRGGEKVGGCDLILNCGQMNESSVSTPDLTNNIWRFKYNNEFKSITLTHTPVADDGDCTTAVKCATCGETVVEAKESHTTELDENKATCTTQAVCDLCGTSYGDLNADNHSYGDWESNDNNTHTRTCANDITHTESGDCSGGTATCTTLAVCENCGASYGESTGEHTFDENSKCTVCGAVCTHSSFADGKCTVCGADCTHETFTDGKCDDCGITGGYCGDVIWTYDEVTKAFAITGTGAMQDYNTYLDRPWDESISENATSVTISEGVTRIGKLAFFRFTQITAVTVPASVESIGYCAFTGCEAMQSITFAEGSRLTAFDDYVFQGCTALKQITLPAGVTSVESSVFSGCNALTDIFVEEGSTTLKDIDGVLYTADGTTLLRYPIDKDDTAFTTPAGVTTIGEKAFQGNVNLETITISEGVTTIGEYAFMSCLALETLNLPDSLTTMGRYMIASNENLTSIALPETLTKIDEGAFGASCLTEIHIPKNVTTIGAYAFAESHNLTTVVIPQGVTTIGEEAFWWMDSLTTVTIPSSVTSIGQAAFQSCDKLTTINAPCNWDTEKPLYTFDSTVAVIVGDHTFDENSKCTVCGYVCPHDYFWGGECETCGIEALTINNVYVQSAVSVTLEGVCAAEVEEPDEFAAKTTQISEGPQVMIDYNILLGKLEWNAIIGVTVTDDNNPDGSGYTGSNIMWVNDAADWYALNDEYSLYDKTGGQQISAYYPYSEDGILHYDLAQWNYQPLYGTAEVTSASVNLTLERKMAKLAVNIAGLPDGERVEAVELNGIYLTADFNGATGILTSTGEPGAIGMRQDGKAWTTMLIPMDQSEVTVRVMLQSGKVYAATFKLAPAAGKAYNLTVNLSHGDATATPNDDGKTHALTCKACGETFDNENCSGGEEHTCMGFACEKCGGWYGEGNADNHVKTGQCDCGMTVYGIWVSDIPVTSENKNNVTGWVDGGIQVQYDPETNILYFTDAKITDLNDDGIALKVDGDITLYLAGESYAYYGDISVAGNLTITGSGYLNVDGVNFGIRAKTVTLGDSVHVISNATQAVDAESVSSSGYSRTAVDGAFGGFAVPGSVGYYEVIGSNLTDDINEDHTVHTRSCGCGCGTPLQEGGRISEATCQSKAVCSLCGEYGETAVHEMDPATGYCKYACGELMAQAQVGSVYYQTLAEASENWSDGTTLTLCADVCYETYILVPAGQTRTLELNGHMITASKIDMRELYAYPALLYNRGVLTIQDSSVSKTGGITVTANSGNAVYNQATMTVIGGTYHCVQGAITSYGNLNISDAVLVSDDDKALYISNSNTSVTISGGSFIGKTDGIYVDTGSATTITSPATISGGEADISVLDGAHVAFAYDLAETECYTIYMNPPGVFAIPVQGQTLSAEHFRSVVENYKVATNEDGSLSLVPCDHSAGFRDGICQDCKQAVKTKLWVAGIRVTSANAGDILGDGTVTYDFEKQILHLNNANIQKLYADDIDVAFIGSDESAVTLNLTGENTISAGDCIGIIAEGADLTICGEGSLTVSGKGAAIIAVNLTISSQVHAIASGVYENACSGVAAETVTVTTDGILTIQTAAAAAAQGNISAYAETFTNNGAVYLTGDVRSVVCETGICGEKAVHPYGDGKCLICGKECLHSDLQFADNGDSKTHSWTCGICGKTESEDHTTTSEATCMNKAVCDLCGEYGEADLTNHVAGCTATYSYLDAATHKVQYSKCGTVLEPQAHVSDTLTCGQQAKCVVCQTSYGAIVDHVIDPATGYCQYNCGEHMAQAKVVDRQNTANVVYVESMAAAMTEAAKDSYASDADVYALANSDETFVIPKSAFFHGGEYTFSGTVTNNGYIYSGTFTEDTEVTSDCAIYGGTFNGKVTNDGYICGGIFNGDVTSRYMISNAGYVPNPIFNGKVTNESVGIIYGGNFEKTSEIINYGLILVFGSNGNPYIDGKLTNMTGGEISDHSTSVTVGPNFQYVDAGGKVTGTHNTTVAATCQNKAVCAFCGEYGEFADHDASYIADDAADTITYKCANCDTQTVTVSLVIPTGNVYGTEFDNPHATGIPSGYEGAYPDIGVGGSGMGNPSHWENAGEYEVTMTWGGETVTGNTKFVVAKADPTYEIPENLTATYGDTLADVKLPTGFAWTDATQSVGNVGTNTFTATYTPADTDNYNVITGIEVSVQVAPKAVTSADITVSGINTYTGSEIKPAVTVAGYEANTDYAVAYSNNVNAGTATVTVSFKGNYSGTVTGSFQIGKATLTVTAGNKSMTTGQALPALTYTITGFVGSETEAVLTTKPTVSCEANGQTAGTFDITVSGAEADNYGFTYVNGTLTVADHVHAWTYTAQGGTITAACGNAATCDKATQTMTLVAPTGSMVYDGKVRSASIDGSIDGVTTPEITYTGDCKSAGTHTASIRLGDAVAKVNFTIDKATVNVAAVAQTRAYGEANPELTYNAGSLVAGNSFTGNLATTATAASAVGEYDITIGTLSAGENYNINFTGAKLTVVKAAAPAIAWPTAAALTYGQKLSESALTSQDTNGTFAWKDGSIVPTVNNSGYTVAYTPKDAKNYDYANVTLEKTIAVTVGKAAPDVTVPTGLTAVYGQTLADVELPAGWAWVNSNASVGDAGTHTFEAVFTPEDTANYNTRTEDLTVNVDKKPVAEPTVGSIHTYTGTEQTVTLNGVESYMTVASGNKGTNAGNYEVEVTLDKNHKWANGSDGKVQWTIAKAQAEINVNTDTITVTYGETVTLPKATTNFGSVTCDKTAADLKNAGTYTVTYSVAGTGNYDGDTKTLTVNIGQKAVAEPTVTGTYTYTGKQQTVTLTGTESYMTIASGDKGTNAGSYEVEITLDNNHKWANGSDGKVQWTIAKAKAVITVNTTPISVTYGDTVTLPTAQTNFGTVTKTHDDLRNVGTYTVTYSVAGTDNYDGDSKTVTVTVNPKPITAADVALNGSLTYTGEELTQNITVAEGITYEVKDNKATKAGSYELTVTGTGNYTGEVKLSWTIKEAAAKLTQDPVAKTLTYNGAEQALVTTGATADGKLVYSLSENGTYAETIPTGKDAGKYTVWYYVQGDANHADSDKVSVEVIIAKAKATITVDTATINVTYGENVTLPEATTNFGTVTCDKTASDLVNAGIYTVTYSVIGTDNYDGDTKTLTVNIAKKAVAEPTVGSIHTYTGTEQTVTLDGVESYMTVASGNKGTNSGSYEVKITLDNNHKWADGSDGKIQWTIAKAQAAITVDTNPINVTYGDTVTLPAATANFGTVTCNKTAADLKNAGTYTVTYSVTGTGNYDGDAVSITVTVNAKPITVTADAVSKTYGEADPELTYTVTGLINGDPITVVLERAQGENVGTYAIAQKTLDAGRNYTIAYTGADLVINAKPITAADVALNGSLAYTGEELTQNITVAEGITYEVTGNKATNAGSYQLTVTGTGNYTGEVKVSWTIKEAAAKLTQNPAAKTLTYNGAEQALVTAGTTADGKLVYSLSENGTYTETVLTGKDAGKYTVWYYVQGDANHSDSDKASVDVTIAKAALTVTAKDHSVIYGDLPANNGVTCSGFVNDETADVLSGQLTYTYSYQQFGNVGDYTITPAGLTSDNYAITFNTGKLTVTAKGVTVKADAVSKTYGEDDPELTYTVTGLVNGDPITAVLERAEGENVGTYAIAQKTLDAGKNYTVTYTGAALTIAQRNVTVTAKDQTITYGQTISGDKFTVTNLVSGHSAAVTLTAGTAKVTAGSTITASDAVITADGVDVTANYAVAYVPGVLVIQPDTAAIDDLTTENVTSADEADIQAVKKMMEEAESTEEAWDTILDNCGDLLDKIQEVSEENGRIEKLADKYDLESVKSSDETALEELKADIEEVLATDNITDEERNTLEGLKAKLTNLLARINGTKELLDQLDKTMDSMDEKTIKSTDKATLEQVIEDAKTLIDSEYITEEEREALKQMQDEAEKLIQAIEDIAEEKKEAADAADTFDTDAVKSTDKAALEDLTKDIQALLNTTNLTEDERKALEELLSQVQDMIDTIEETSEKRKEASDAIDAVDPETVTSADKAELQQAINTIDVLLKDDHLTEDEREALTEAKAQAEDLLDTIQSVKDALITDNTEKVENVTAGNVQLRDKKALEAAKADLEKALADNGSHYTQAEKQAIREEIARIDAAIQAVERVESLENDLHRLPGSVEPDDEVMEQKILAAKAAYDAMTEHEKSLVDHGTVRKLNSLIYDLTDYEIVKGADGKWMKGDGYNLTFTANGPFRKFVGIEVDGKPVRERNYTAKAGSTIITLKESYLKGLEDGMHTLTVKFVDGEVSCNFRILPKTAAPATGDVSDMTLWTSGMITSALALAIVMLLKKKNPVK